jgi:hypothetical protein
MNGLVSAYGYKEPVPLFVAIKVSSNPAGYEVCCKVQQKRNDRKPHTEVKEW